MASPTKQFVIEPLVPFELGGTDLSFTNSSLFMVLSVITATLFLSLAMRKKEMIPGRLQMFGELTYEFVAKMVRDNIGPKGRGFFPFVFTIFMFVLMGNFLGLIPKSFTFTSHIAVTATLALVVFSSVIIFGIINHGLKFFTLFIPSGVPIWIMPFIVPLEIISFFVRPLTHAVRLFANMMAGHIVLKIIATFAVTIAGAASWGFIVSMFPAFIGMGFIMFELLIAFIQAYVFAVLTCVYLKDTVDLHH